MEKSIDIIFWISLLTALLKSADLILRKHQQKWVEDKLDTLTLKLSYSNIFKWYSKHLNSALLNLLGLVSLIFVTSQLHDSVSQIFQNTLLTNPYVYIGVFLYSIYFYLRTQEFQKGSFKYLDGKDIENNNEDYTLNIFIKRALLVLGRFFLVIILQSGVLSLAIYLLDIYYLHFNISMINFFIISGLPTLINFLGILVSIFFVLLFTLLVWSLHLLLKSIEAICWRIVEFNKGAVFAINIIITTILGILEIFYKP